MDPKATDDPTEIEVKRTQRITATKHDIAALFTQPQN